MSLNAVGKTSILTTTNVDILQSIHTKAVRNDVYNKSDIGLKFSSLIGAALAVLNRSVALATALGNDYNYATTRQNQINNKSDNITTYTTSDVNVALSIVQAGVDNHVLLNAVDIKGKFKLKSVSNDILKLQKVDGSTVYDALELSFNSIDKTSILNNYNVDILQSINTKAVSNGVYNQSDIDLKCSSLVGAAPAVLNTSVKLYTALGHDSTCATTI